MPTPNDIPTYTLLVDLPFAPKGTDIYPTSALGFGIKVNDHLMYEWTNSEIGNTDYFKRKAQPIVVSEISGKKYKIRVPDSKGYQYDWLTVRTTYPILEDKYDSIKQAIEKVLNPTQTQWSELSFTKEKLDAMMENVWNAAREKELNNKWEPHPYIQNAHTWTSEKYKTFKDYYNSLPENITNGNEQPNKQETKEPDAELKDIKEDIYKHIPRWRNDMESKALPLYLFEQLVKYVGKLEEKITNKND